MRLITISRDALASLATEVTRRGRSVKFVARGGSMFPTIFSGDEVVVASVKPGEIRPGDIVLVGGIRPLLHRVVRIENSTGRVVTKGDATDTEDLPVGTDAVIGKLVGVERPFSARVLRFVARCGRNRYLKSEGLRACSRSFLERFWRVISA